MNFKRVIVLLIAVLSVIQLNATHLVGGTMTYECLGNNVYKIKLTIYRDCSPGTTGFDDLASISIFNGANNSILHNEFVSFQSVELVPIIINNPCLISPPTVCVEKAEYEFIKVLPSIPGGYNISYQRCCRNGNAVNILTPGSMGATYTVHIPESNIADCNNSPTFNNPPPTVMCQGYEFTYDLSATDVDGDSLVYLFSDPINGGTETLPNPSPALSPPYTNIPWSAGYSTNNQINSNPQFTLDPLTGFLVGTPLSQGFYTFCIKVEEYRDGVFVDFIYRDFILVITNCQSNTVANFPAQNNFCDGLALNFNNTSLNSTYFYWDFGDPTVISDTSNLSLPSYTYQNSGIYTVMLVANPGYFCEDTIYRQFEIFPEIQPNYITPLNQCLLNNQFNIKGTGNFDANGVLTWGVSNTSTIQNFGQDSIQVSYLDTGFQVISFTVENHGCVETFTDSVYVHPNPIANFQNQTTFCNGLTYDFTNQSINASTYNWDFGDVTTATNFSQLEHPNYTYADTGSYTVTLIASQMDLCYDTAYNNFHILPNLSTRFIPDTLCFNNHQFDLSVVGNHNFSATYLWNFSSTAMASNTITEHVQISYPDTGNYAVTLTVNNYGCTFIYTDTLGVYPNPIPQFSVDTNLGCQPLLIHFYDSSYSYSEPTYFWSFGDNNASSLQNPTHVYVNSGVFDVSLTVITDSFCVDTVTLHINNLITVNPKPKASFTISTLETYFMNHLIELEDKSEELYQEFDMGDGTYFMDRNVSYEYADTGHFNVAQIVTNQYECSDTTIKTIWVKPDLLVFVPNSFTPNNDGLNDVFLPKIRGIVNYSLTIYDRWGEQIFKSNNLLHGWDGSYKGNICKSEVYNWIIKVKTVDFLTPTYRGHINLIK